MNDMINSELVWNILKYNHPTPCWIRQVIDDILEHIILDNDFDWEDITSDNSLGSIKVKNTHFFEFFVYYDTNIDGTVVTIKFKEPSYAHKISQTHILSGVDFYTIYCDGMSKTDFVDEFSGVVEDFYKLCLRAEYMEEYPDD